MRTGPIILVDDDADDIELIKHALEALQIDNEIIVFHNGSDFCDYMFKTEKRPFLILCDLNMPNLNGLEVKKKISDNALLREKCIPFIFLSTASASPAVRVAYSLSAQGYFIKPYTIAEYIDMLQAMIQYWGHAQHPNK